MSKLNAAPLPNVSDDWYAVEFDETHHWNLPDEFAPYVERVMGVYFYDATERTFCGEIAPSHYMRFLYNYIVLSPDTPEDPYYLLPESFDNDYAHKGDDFYMYVYAVNEIPSTRKKRYGATDPDCEGEDAREAEVREYFQGNCPF